MQPGRWTCQNRKIRHSMPSSMYRLQKHHSFIRLIILLQKTPNRLLISTQTYEWDCFSVIAFIPIRILNNNSMYSRNRQILNQQATPNHQSFHWQQRHIGRDLSSWKANISGKKSSITRRKQLLLQKMMICELSWEDASLYLKIYSSQDTAHCCRIGLKGLNKTRM